MSDIVPTNDPKWKPAAQPAPAGPVSPGYPPPQPMRTETFDLPEFIGMIRRRFWLILAITLASGALAGFLASLQPPQYHAKATVRLKNESQAITGGIAGQATEQLLGKTADPLLSEIQVLRSRTVLFSVVQRAGLRIRSITDGVSATVLQNTVLPRESTGDTLFFAFARDQFEVRTSKGKWTGHYGQPIAIGGLQLSVSRRPDAKEAAFEIVSAGQAVDDLLANLHVRPVERTDAIEIEYTSTDASLAQIVVNTAVDAFQAASIHNNVLASQRRRMFLEEQLARTDSSLRIGQGALSEFRQREEVLSPRDQFAAQQVGLMQLQLRREELDADRRMLASLTARMERDANPAVLKTIMASPAVAENRVIGQLYTQFVQYNSARDSLIAAGRSERSQELTALNQLIASSQAQLKDAVRSHVVSMDARIAALDSLYGRSAADIRSLPAKEAEQMRLEQRFEDDRRLVEQLREEYQKARIAEAVEAGQVEVLDLAELPVAPVGNRRSLQIMLGLLIGLIVGLGVAFLREHLNTTIIRREDLEHELGLPSLAVVPRLTEKLDSGRIPLRARIGGASAHGSAVARHFSGLVSITDSQSPGAEAYRHLRTSLLFSQESGALRSLMVTSAVAAEGKTTTAANLAVAFAHQGMRVIIVDADLRKPRLHKVFDVSREPGLADALVGRANLIEIERPTEVDGLTVISAGSATMHPSELLGSDRMRKLVEALEEQCDLVVIDSAPVLVAGDASIVGNVVDGAVLVLRAGQTDKRVAHAAVLQLRNVHAKVLGAVLNDPDAKLPKFDRSYATYAYGYYGESEA
jgi:polysaccharide biosynthesis transport protein